MQGSEVAQEVGAVLDVLAQRFGTTVEYLWEILVRQAAIEGWLNLFGSVMCVIGLFLCWRLIVWARHKDAAELAQAKAEDKANGGYRSSYYSRPDNTGYFIASIIGGTLLIILYFVYLFNGLSYLLNPEFHALKYILGTV